MTITGWVERIWSITLPQTPSHRGRGELKKIKCRILVNSPRAIDVSIYVVRAFARIRRMVAVSHDIIKKIDELEHNVAIHDKAIRSLFDAIRKLMALPEKKTRRIGFELKNR